VAMRHDQRADHARAHSPARGPAELLLTFAILETNIARAREILTQEMRRAGLNCFSILHHRLDRERLDGAREPLTFRFFTTVNGNGEMIANERFVDIQHL